MPPKRRRAADDDRRTLTQLRELIEALDRRLPQIEAVGELAIARDAAGIRTRALDRIREIEARITVRTKK